MEVVSCKVNAIKSYGVFVTCGDYDGLLHISEIADQYVNDVAQIFEIGDVINLAVLERDERYKKMKLSYKKNHPMHERIRKHAQVQIGFNSINRKMDEWLNLRRKDNEN